MTPKAAAVTTDRKPRRPKRTVAEKRADLVDRVTRCEGDLEKATADLMQFDLDIQQQAAALLAGLGKE
jgi:hypothetical protein